MVFVRNGSRQDRVWRCQPCFGVPLVITSAHSSASLLLSFSVEMGLGKTVEALALVNLNPMTKPTPAPYMPTPDKGLWMRYPSRGTLIIASTSLVGQVRSRECISLNGVYALLHDMERVSVRCESV